MSESLTCQWALNTVFQRSDKSTATSITQPTKQQTIRAKDARQSFLLVFFSTFFSFSFLLIQFFLAIL